MITSNYCPSIILTDEPVQYGGDDLAVGTGAQAFLGDNGLNGRIAFHHGPQVPQDGDVVVKIILNGFGNLLPTFLGGGLSGVDIVQLLAEEALCCFWVPSDLRPFNPWPMCGFVMS